MQILEFAAAKIQEKVIAFVATERILGIARASYFRVSARRK